MDLEAGRYDPTVGFLKRIAKELGLKPSQLIDCPRQETPRMIAAVYARKSTVKKR